MTTNADAQQRIDILNEAAWKQRYSHTAEAEKKAAEALRLSEGLAYGLGKGYALLNLGVCSFLLSKGDERLLQNLREAQVCFEQASDRLGLTRALNGIANVYDSYGEYEKGLEYCFGGLKMAREGTDSEILSDLLSTTGNIYYRLGDYAQALNAYQESLDIREKTGELKAAASSLNLMGRTHAAKGEFEKGLECYQKSIALRESLGETGALPWSYIGLAALYEKKEEPDKAFVYYSRCLALNASNKDKRLDLHVYIGTGRYQISLGDFAAGLRDLLKAQNLAEELNAKPLLYEVHHLLAALYEKKGDAEKALNHFRNFHALKEEVLNRESGNRLKNQQISFAVERSEQEAEIHRLRNVELKSAYEKIEERNKDITSSINYARRIQQAMLPREGMLQEFEPDSFVLFAPKDIVSGDFYWMSPAKAGAEEGFFVAAADCTGHGVPGAFMSMLGMEKLNEAAALSQSPATMLHILNKSIKKALGQTGSEGETRDGMDIALLHIVYPDGGRTDQVRVFYAAANRPLWIIRKDAELEEIKATKVAIGGHTSDEQEFTGHELVLSKGDTVYLFTDGYADQFSASGKKFMTRKMKDLLLDIRCQPLAKQKEMLLDLHLNWRGDMEQTDDVLVIGIRL
jgi:serine phosphatase RsbU (regulator of sigma subunit)/Tfp pilus assembly protein PilF